MREIMVDDANNTIVTVETTDLNLSKAFDLAYERAKEYFEDSVPHDETIPWNFELIHKTTTFCHEKNGDRNHFEYEFIIRG